jgi:hypothetical protein
MPGRILRQKFIILRKACSSLTLRGQGNCHLHLGRYSWSDSGSRNLMPKETDGAGSPHTFIRVHHQAVLIQTA